MEVEPAPQPAGMTEQELRDAAQRWYEEFQARETPPPRAVSPSPVPPPQSVEPPNYLPMPAVPQPEVQPDYLPMPVVPQPEVLPDYLPMPVVPQPEVQPDPELPNYRPGNGYRDLVNDPESPRYHVLPATPAPAPPAPERRPLPPPRFNVLPADPEYPQNGYRSMLPSPDAPQPPAPAPAPPRDNAPWYRNL
tara:strand:- start:4019 stop:4594 length:576 start_codon:yes stop_codon:yes gene_type:complete